ncbi:DUF3302 domain-containing protein [Bythopirellula goksoeyrii]|uniref:Inner membrane protein YiaW n=1 Tax=Bythopirellula goksoeyrii TaxID=1400387 RepID=A0A5B9QGM6_9BACT|nr:DUF3302 domain-containing protein [Bythopirellula goksoeyrii]QEG33501.1 Inner membrane protein YiaW [Bythopirellula goksoeyrii]
MDGFDYFAFFVIAVLVAAVVVIVVELGSLPGKIARARNHPHADAVNAASWISLVTLGLLWPLAFVWAFIAPPSSRSANEGDSVS